MIFSENDKKSSHNGLIHNNVFIRGETYSKNLSIMSKSFGRGQNFLLFLD